MSMPTGQPTRLHVAPGIFFTERRSAGISFTERMSGWWMAPMAAPDDEEVDPKSYEEAYRQGYRAGCRLELVLTIIAEDLDTMLADTNHKAGFVGTAMLKEPGQYPVPALVTNGSFQLFVDEPRDRIASRRMKYDADIEAVDGRRWRLSGYKSTWHGGGAAAVLVSSDVQALERRASRIWRDQTRLFFTLTPLDGGAQGGGILSLSFGDLVRQLMTIRARGAPTLTERWDTFVRFFMFFVGVLRDTYGGPFARSRYAPPNWWRREPLRPPLVKTSHRFTTRDGVELQLTRYVGAGRGQVMLAPGFGVRAASFAIDTVDQNIVEFLHDKGFDVWLFDYRASPELKASGGVFSIDDIAEYDWPAAVNYVWRNSGARPVHVIAHCVGAMSFMMSALANKLHGRIASAVCSQVAAHPVGSRLNELKAIARMGRWLDVLFGVRSLRVTVHAQDTYRKPLLDRLLKFYPTEDPCDNPVCRRVRFVFGESYLHANLNRRTHDAVIEMFGDPSQGAPARASLRALKHLANIVAKGRVIGEDGDDAYVREENVDRLDFRLCLMSGTLNAIFPPRGIEKTFRWLEDVRKRRPKEGAEIVWLPIVGYAHMDCFIGVRAAGDVFPSLAQWLAGESLSGPSARAVPATV